MWAACGKRAGSERSNPRLTENLPRGEADPADELGRDSEETNISLVNEGHLQHRKSKGKGRRRRNRVLKWGNINAQSLVNKMNLLDEEIKKHELKIVSVTETWGKEEIKASHFSIKDFNMYRNDRKNKAGGGTILYVSSDIEQRSCRPLNTGGYKSSSWCWLVEKVGKKILVGSIYRSTDSSPENDELLLKKIEQAYEIAGDNRLLLLGDFNLPGIDWKDKDLKRGNEN